MNNLNDHNDLDPSLDPLNSNSIDLKEHFKTFIKTKTIEELIAYDNKIFSEVRNLESEKHILVTQNYKKFIAATETINTIKSSLVGFEKDLLNLQGKVQNLVQNFTTINSSVEDKLKETEDLYRIKKDLKRLKFINDLPSVLERQLNEYLTFGGKDVKILEKSLSYYEKCKDFLYMHKDNSLVKDIYTRTMNLIFKYNNIITDEMHMPDFNEFSLEMFDTCLSLLVKIEDNQSQLILTFIDRYNHLISKKFDEIFSMREGVNEIDFTTYLKVYDNYEFAINENEFLFYEDQITQQDLLNRDTQNMTNKEQHGTFPSMQAMVSKNLNVNIPSLCSKYFKKGTFMWICKKIQENVINNLIAAAYKSFIALFGKKNSAKINDMLQHLCEIFFKKVKDLLEKIKKSPQDRLDPIFFKEGLMTFYKSFTSEILMKFNDDALCSSVLSEKILRNNKILLMAYISSMQISYIAECSEVIKTSLAKVQLTHTMYLNSSASSESSCEGKSLCNLDKNLYLIEANTILAKLTALLLENAQLLKKLDINELNINNSLGDDTTKIQLRYLTSFIGEIFLIMRSTNYLKFNSVSCQILQDDDALFAKKMINDILNPITKERIFLMIIFCKQMNTPSIIKPIVDKMLRDFPSIKNTKPMYSELRSYVDKEINESLSFIFDSLVQLYDHIVFEKLKALFYDVNWILYENPASFRLQLKLLCFDLYQLRLDLFTILAEEAKSFQEMKISSISDPFVGIRKRQKVSKVQKEMECIHIRRLSIYGANLDSPQMILYTIAKIFLKVINEMIKIKKFSTGGYQQLQLDMSFVHAFFKDNLITFDIESILEGFFFEIMKNCAFNTTNVVSFNEDLISELIKVHNKDFKEMVNALMNSEEK